MKKKRVLLTIIFMLILVFTIFASANTFPFMAPEDDGINQDPDATPIYIIDKDGKLKVEYYSSDEEYDLILKKYNLTGEIGAMGDNESDSNNSAKIIPEEVIKKCSENKRVPNFKKYYRAVEKDLCFDKIDNDCDGLMDCEDPECSMKEECQIECDYLNNQMCCEENGGIYSSTKCCILNLNDNWCDENIRCYNGALYTSCDGGDKCFFGKCFDVENYYDLSELDSIKDSYPVSEDYKFAIETIYREETKEYENRDIERIYPLTGVTDVQLIDFENSEVEEKINIKITPDDGAFINSKSIVFNVISNNIFLDKIRFEIDWRSDKKNEYLILIKEDNKYSEFGKLIDFNSTGVYEYRIIGYTNHGEVFYESRYYSILVDYPERRILEKDNYSIMDNNKLNDSYDINGNSDQNFSTNLEEVGEYNNNSVIVVGFIEDMEENLGVKPIILGEEYRIHEAKQTDRIKDERMIISPGEKILEREAVNSIRNKVRKNNIYDSRDIISRIDNNEELDYKYIKTVENIDIRKKAVKVNKEEGNSTIVYVRLDPKKTLHNVSIYESIPKEVANSVYDLRFSNDPIVLDEDPLIMWYFAKVDDKMELSYEVKGEVESEVIETTKTITIADEVRDPWYYVLIPLLLVPLIVGFFLYFSGFGEKKQEHHFILKNEIKKQATPDGKMDINNLRDYIINSYNMGVDKQDIEKSLVKIGWDKKIIAQEINHVFG